MQAITTVGLDIAKSVFQVHGVDAAGKVIVRCQLKRRHVLPFFQRLPACVVGMEACATSIEVFRRLRRAQRGANILCWHEPDVVTKCLELTAGSQ
jgi:transposase